MLTTYLCVWHCSSENVGGHKYKRCEVILTREVFPGATAPDLTPTIEA